MNKEEWNAVNILINSFIEREKLLKELLEDREKEIVQLKESLSFYDPC
jgi:hypothetical protein